MPGAAVAPPDGGFGWVVCFSAAGASLTALVPLYSFSVLYLEYVTHLDADVATVAWVISLFVLTVNFGMIFAANFIRYYGCRKVALFSHALAGVAFCLVPLSSSLPPVFILYQFAAIGTGISFSCGVICTQQWFKRRQAIATSICMLSASVGGMLFPSLTRLLVDTYGWRGACLLCGAMCLQGLVFESLLRPSPVKSAGPAPPHPCTRAAVTSLCRPRLLLSGRFLLGSLGTGFNNAVILLFLSHTVNYLVFRGYSRQAAAQIISLTYCGNAPGRLLAGAVVTAGRLNALPVAALSQAVGAALLAVLTAAPLERVGLQVVLVLEGFVIGGGSALMLIVNGQLCRPEDLAHGLSLLAVTLGVGGAAAPAAAGLLYHVTRDYGNVMVLAACCHGAAGLLYLMAYSVVRWRRRT